MGIQGLLPVLKSITTTRHISSYRGQTVAVDAYCWLHRGAYSCARELCEGTYTTKYVEYCMHRVRMMEANGVRPLIVFDGGKLPIKGTEDSSRDGQRAEMHLKAEAHLRAGNRNAANECFQKAVDITPAIAKRFVDALKSAGVEFIVAPYEADAQMAYLAINGRVSAVVTEDSDLLAYGCPRVLFKMDKAGEGQEVCLSDLPRCRELSFVGFTHTMFVEMCVMAGCDFLKALPGIGIKKAHACIKKMRSFDRACRSLRFGGTAVPCGYEEAFQRALWTFKHQRVFCPEQRSMLHLRPISDAGLSTHAGMLRPSQCIPEGDSATELIFLGPLHPADVARAIADGDLDPISLASFATQDRPVRGAGVPPAGQVPHSQSGGLHRRPLPVEGQCSISKFLTPPSAAARKEFCKPRRNSTSCLRESWGALDDQATAPAPAAVKSPSSDLPEQPPGVNAESSQSNTGSESHPQAQACINRLYPGSEEQPPSLATFWRRYAPVVANSPQSSRSPSPTASPADLGNCQALAAEVATDRISPGTSEITDRDGSPPRARASSEAAHGGAVQGDRRPAFVYQLPCPGGTASVWEEARESPDQDGGVAGAAGRTGLKRPLPGVNNPPSDAVASARPPLAELNANGKAAGKLPAAGGKAVTTSRFFKARPSAEARGEEAGASQAPGSGDDIKQDPGETGPGGETPCAEGGFGGLGHLSNCRKVAGQLLDRVQFKGLERFRFSGTASLAQAARSPASAPAPRHGPRSRFVPPRRSGATPTASSAAETPTKRRRSSCAPLLQAFAFKPK